MMPCSTLYATLLPTEYDDVENDKFAGSVNELKVGRRARGAGYTAGTQQRGGVFAVDGGVRRTRSAPIPCHTARPYGDEIGLSISKCDIL